MESSLTPEELEKVEKNVKVIEATVRSYLNLVSLRVQQCELRRHSFDCWKTEIHYLSGTGTCTPNMNTNSWLVDESATEMIHHLKQFSDYELLILDPDLVAGNITFDLHKFTLKLARKALK